MDLLVPAFAAGIGFIVIVELFELLHPNTSVSIKLYVVFTAGLTEMLEDGEVNPAGIEVHEYVFPDMAAAPRFVVLPEHIAVLEPALADGRFAAVNCEPPFNVFDLPGVKLISVW